MLIYLCKYKGQCIYFTEEKEKYCPNRFKYECDNECHTYSSWCDQHINCLQSKDDEKNCWKGNFIL